MAKEGIVSIHGKEYKTVAYRVNQFRGEHPDWGIETELIESDDTHVVMKAIIKQAGLIIGTGFAEEQRGSSQINKTSALENCETSAIGRALAACGYAGTEYASANEVQNAIQQQGTVRFAKGAKEEVLNQSIKYLEQGDEDGLRQVWAEFDADEKVALWPMFNSTQRAAIKALMK